MIKNIEIMIIFANKYHIVKERVMTGSHSITDMYMTILSSLSDEDKLDLISKLSESIRMKRISNRVRPDLRTCFSGDWTGMVAEDMRNNDYHGRPVNEW